MKNIKMKAGTLVSKIHKMTHGHSLDIQNIGDMIAIAKGIKMIILAKVLQKPV